MSKWCFWRHFDVKMTTNSVSLLPGIVSRKWILAHDISTMICEYDIIAIIKLTGIVCKCNRRLNLSSGFIFLLHYHDIGHKEWYITFFVNTTISYVQILIKKLYCINRGKRKLYKISCVSINAETSFFLCWKNLYVWRFM